MSPPNSTYDHFANQLNDHRAPGISLLLLALISGVVWRAELELRSGWAGLAWVSYFHWAVPVCTLAFIVWVVCVARVRRQYFFTAALLTFAFAAYFAVDLLFSLYFASGPHGMLTVLFLGGGDFDKGFTRLWIVRFIFPPIWPLLPLTFCAICRAFGVSIDVRTALFSAVLFTVSWPISIVVRGFIEDRGSPDLIHALKSGFVIPFLVISLGFPLLRFRAPHAMPPPERE